MRPKFQNISKIFSNFQKIAPAKQGETNPKFCQLCERSPKEAIQSLQHKARRRHIYAGLYTVIKLGEDRGKILKVCRHCFLLSKQFRLLRPALPPGAKRRSRHKRL